MANSGLLQEYDLLLGIGDCLLQILIQFYVTHFLNIGKIGMFLQEIISDNRWEFWLKLFT
jgi:hypothetical protein